MQPIQFGTTVVLHPLLDHARSIAVNPYGSYPCDINKNFVYFDLKLVCQQFHCIIAAKFRHIRRKNSCILGQQKVNSTENIKYLLGKLVLGLLVKHFSIKSLRRRDCQYSHHAKINVTCVLVQSMGTLIKMHFMPT